MTLLFTFVIATLVTMVLLPPVIYLSQRLHLVDLPGVRKIHSAPMPRVGGIAMAAGVVLPALMWATMSHRMMALLLGIVVILAFGVWDDLKGIDYRLKFLGQIIAVSIVVAYGGVVVQYAPFSGSHPWPTYVAIPVTMFALVGVTNAINLSDGLDGLAGGLTLLSLGIIGILFYPSDTGMLLVTASIMGSIVGFLRFNTYPARVFMGDGGSQLLGFSTGVLVIVLTQDSNTALSPALPLMILGLPILDTLMVIMARIKEGRSPFLPDRNHIHHKLLALGMHHYEAVFVIYFLQTLLVGAAYFLRFEDDALILSLWALFWLLATVVLHIAVRRGWQLHRHIGGIDASGAPRWIAWLRKDQRILKVAFHAAMGSISLYFLAGGLFVEQVPHDIGLLSSVLLAVLILFYFLHGDSPFNMVERACAYVTGICVVYLGQAVPGALIDFTACRNALLAIIAIAVAIGFRFSKDRFQITTMDFLVIVVAVVVPNLSGFDGGRSAVGVGAAILIVLLYGIELVLNNTLKRWNLLRLAMCATLALLGLRGLAAI